MIAQKIYADGKLSRCRIPERIVLSLNEMASVNKTQYYIELWKIIQKRRLCVYDIVITSLNSTALSRSGPPGKRVK